MPLTKRGGEPWVEPSKASLPTLPQSPHPTRVEAEILEMRRSYQALLAMLLPQYRRDVVQVAANQEEGEIQPWAAVAFFVFPAIASLPASIQIDGLSWYPDASSRPVIKLPVRDCRGWGIQWGSVTPVAFQILFSSDVRDEVAGL